MRHETPDRPAATQPDRSAAARNRPAEPVHPAPDTSRPPQPPRPSPAPPRTRSQDTNTATQPRAHEKRGCPFRTPSSPPDSAGQPPSARRARFSLSFLPPPLRIRTPCGICTHRPPPPTERPAAWGPPPPPPSSPAKPLPGTTSLPLFHPAATLPEPLSAAALPATSLRIRRPGAPAAGELRHPLFRRSPPASPPEPLSAAGASRAVPAPCGTGRRPK